VTDHVFVAAGSFDEPIVGVDLASGEDLWSWTRPSHCEANDGDEEPGQDAVLVPLVCHGAGGATSVLIGIDDRTGTERWRFTGPATEYPDPLDADLTASPDRRVAVYAPGPGGADVYSDQVLLDSATGAVRYRTGGNPEVVQPDARTPVLRREIRGGDAQLIVRDLSTGAERPLASPCPALHASDLPSRADVRDTAARPFVTPASVLVLCFDARSGTTPRVTVEAYARSNGTTPTTIATVDPTGPPDGPWDITLIPAAGAVALLVQNWRATAAQVLGLA
jgi:hypothetical protein